MHGQNVGGGTTPTGVMSPGDEKTWSIVAHLSVILAPIGALIVWLMYKDKSPKVTFHALQALWYQLAWIGIFIAYFVVATILSVVTLGIAAIVLFPLMFIIPFIPLVHGCYAAYRVSQGEEYRYPLIADKVDGGRQRIV